MTLRAIHAKPGSGKSAYAVSLIVKQLSDWVRYEREHQERYSRILYTNIPLHIDAINDYLSKELCLKDVDISDYVELLDETFFRTSDGKYREWWSDFPEGAFIVIDEVHHYLPASIKRKKDGGVDYADKFTNYVSMHRHRQHDIILLSQHLDNVSVEVKKQIETVYEILNVKNRIVGVWPLTVPMADIDVVREAWGFPVQLAHIRRGICEARRIIYDKGYEVFIMTPAIFALYRSHTKSDEALDRPSLKLGRIGSIIWICRRHLFRFIFWICVGIGILMAFRNMFTELPGALVQGMLSGVHMEQTSHSSEPVRPEPVQPEPIRPGHTSIPATFPGQTQPEHFDTSLPGKLIDDPVRGFTQNGVITPKGVLRIGDKIIIEGIEEEILTINFQDSTIHFSSGKKYRK